MKYIDQNIDDLKITFIKGEFDYNKLTVLKEKNLSCNNYLIKAAVIGASHAISFINKKTNKVVFTEIVANYFDINNNYTFNSESFNRKIVFNTNDLFKNEYIFSSKVIDAQTIYGLEKIKNFYKNNEKENSINIKFDFLPKKIEHTFLAQTIIHINYHKETNLLNINTLHVYPNNLKALETTSKILI